MIKKWWWKKKRIKKTIVEAKVEVKYKHYFNLITYVGRLCRQIVLISNTLFINKYSKLVYAP